MAPKKRGPAPSKNPSDQNSSACKPSRPAWPPISESLPAAQLTLEVLLPGQILTIPGLWTRGLCKSYITFLKTLPLTTTPGQPKKGEAVRVNDRYQIDDAQFAAQLWSRTALEELVTHPVIDGEELGEEAKQRLWGGRVLGLNSNIRIYRYRKGQYFDKHFDDSNLVTFPSHPSTNVEALQKARTTWTLLLYLSSVATGCKGGETVFHPDAPNKREATPEPIVSELDVGMALLHRHGRDCLLHEGREVTEGEKWVIRSDLCVEI